MTVACHLNANNFNSFYQPHIALLYHSVTTLMRSTCKCGSIDYNVYTVKTKVFTATLICPSTHTSCGVLWTLLFLQCIYSLPVSHMSNTYECCDAWWWTRNVVILHMQQEFEGRQGIVIFLHLSWMIWWLFRATSLQNLFFQLQSVSCCTQDELLLAP